MILFFIVSNKSAVSSYIMELAYLKMCVNVKNRDNSSRFHFIPLSAILVISTKSLSKEEKQFLISFKSKKPNWSLLGLENIESVQELPSVKWKMKNLMQMSIKKHEAALEKLIQSLE